MTLSLTVGQTALYYAKLLDSLNEVVTVADTTQIIWDVDVPSIVSIGPHPVTGPSVLLRAIQAGSATVTARFESIENKVIVEVSLPDVSSIEVDQNYVWTPTYTYPAAPEAPA
jgi:hypothetical protein